VCTAAQVTGNAFTQVSPTNVTLTLTNDATLSWQWQTQYWMDVVAGSGGSVDASSRWWSAGAVTSLTASADEFYHFDGWTGTVNSASNPVVVVITNVQQLVALFAENRTSRSTPERWLARYYPSTSDFEAAAMSDTDGDGAPAWMEHIMGTDPTNRLSVLCVSNSWSGGQTVLCWPSASGRLYRVALSSNLVVGFDPISGVITGIPPSNCYTDDVPRIPPVFYRIGVESGE